MKYLKRDLESAYIRYRSQSLLLEEIAYKGPITKDESVSRLIFSMYKSDRHLSCKAGMWELSDAVGTLLNLGLIKFVDHKLMDLTEEGRKALQSGVFQNLSHNAFRDYIAYRNQILQYRISIIALLVSITSLILSVRSMM